MIIKKIITVMFNNRRKTMTKIQRYYKIVTIKQSYYVTKLL